MADLKPVVDPVTQRRADLGTKGVAKTMGDVVLEESYTPGLN